MTSPQRFRKAFPCPICRGYDNLPRHKGVRCNGFLSSDGAYAHCSREDDAGGLPAKGEPPTYAHKLTGDCKCGVRHDPAPPPVSTNGRQHKRQEATYPYVDADGRLLYQVVRYRLPNGDKTFSQRRPDGHGGWIWNMTGVTPVIYNLPAVLEAIALGKPIVTAEGEEDVNALIARGYAATCNHGGAEKWDDRHSTLVQGAVEVIICGDNDAAGRRHVAKQIASLQTVDIVPRLAHMDGLPEHGDISDWLKTHSREDLDRLIAEATPATEDDSAPEDRTFPPLASISYTAQELQQKVIPDLVEVIPGILPEGLAMIAGGAGLGKSFFCLQVAIDVCRGSKFLGQWPTITGDVLYLATEDSERRIRDRIRQMWNDESLWPANLTVSHRPQTLDTGLIDQLNEWLDTHPQVRLIVIDLFADVRPPRKPSGDWYADDRAAAKLLSTLGNTRQLCVLASHHTNRLKSDDPFESFHGGNGLLGAAETKMILQPQQEGQAIWRMKGRDVAEQAYLLRLEEGAWEYEGEAVIARMSQSRQDILAYFQANAGYSSAETVAKALGKNTHTTRNLIEKLCQQRLVVKGDGGIYRLFQKDTL